MPDQEENSGSGYSKLREGAEWAMAAVGIVLVLFLIGAAYNSSLVLLGLTTFSLKGMAGGILLAVTLRLTLME